eukprot:scaffold16624_cov342-Amphora_coffeaeformis.AAC.1
MSKTDVVEESGDWGDAGNPDNDASRVCNGTSEWFEEEAQGTRGCTMFTCGAKKAFQAAKLL